MHACPPAKIKSRVWRFTSYSENNRTDGRTDVTVESYTAIYAADSHTYYYYFSITHSLFHSRLRLKAFFSANPSHRSLSFSSSGLTTWIPQTFTVTSEHIRFHFLVFLFYTF